MTVDLPYRYAIYFAPDVNGEIWQSGSRWLGRCASSQRLFELPIVSGLSREQLSELTADPRRYGFHATLKAPFVLSAKVTERELYDRVQELAESWSSFALPALRVRCLDQFLALTLGEVCTQLNELEKQCVTLLHPYAAPLEEAALFKRKKAGLTEREEELLIRWGYPYVLDRFRFHLSLTSSLAEVSPAQRQAVQRAAEEHFSALPVCLVDSLSIFVEPSPGAAFLLDRKFPLLGKKDSSA